jgi:transposase-like protein
MAQNHSTTELGKMLLRFVLEPDPMLAMLTWLCELLMEAEVDAKLAAGKSERTDSRQGYRSGYRPRRFDTRLGTMYLMVPKLRQGGYIPFFVTARQRSETALIEVIQEAFVNGVSTRKMEKLAQSLGIESLSHTQVSNMTKELDEQVKLFRNRPLTQEYPILWVDALYEDIRIDRRVRKMAVLVVCGVNSEGKRDILAIEPMMEESHGTYSQLFESLKDRGLKTPHLVVSDAHAGIRKAVSTCFLGASWQRCKVHFMRNILCHIPSKNKEHVAARLKQIWLQPDEECARQMAQTLIEEWSRKYEKAVEILEAGLEDSLQFYHFKGIDPRKISSTNVLERLNREIRRRTRVVSIFPNPASYVRLVTAYLMEYAEDWSTAKGYINHNKLEELIQAEQS